MLPNLGESQQWEWKPTREVRLFHLFTSKSSHHHFQWSIFRFTAMFHLFTNNYWVLSMLCALCLTSQLVLLVISGGLNYNEFCYFWPSRWYYWTGDVEIAMHKGRLGELHRYIHVCSQMGTYIQRRVCSQTGTQRNFMIGYKKNCSPLKSEIFSHCNETINLSGRCGFENWPQRALLYSYNSLIKISMGCRCLHIIS